MWYFHVIGCTALLDAMGKTLYCLWAGQKQRKDSNRVVTVIITDGMENASRQYTYAAVRRLVERQKGQGWEFLFLEANIDAIREGGGQHRCELKKKVSKK